MPNTVIVGAQWGDEGKAKVIDYLTSKADIIARFQGGANAGHTVVVGESKYVFHLVPSGIIYPDKVCIIGNGVVFDAEQFLHEVDEIQARGISVDGRLFISDRAHLVLPYHKEHDKISEDGKGEARIGTTGRGIGPAYADKVSRRGIRAGDLRDWNAFAQNVRTLIERKSSLMDRYYGTRSELDTDQVIEQCRQIRERILPFLTDTSRYVCDSVRQGRQVLFEGAQGTFLDIDHGTYPFVTSSNTIAGAACTGLGVGPSLVDHVVGIVKTYTTRVGNGPFPTELNDSDGEELRRTGGEFGATTGRPRRCGWFDSVMVRKAVELNGMTRMALTKLDVLNGFDEIRLCTHYRIGSEIVADFPSDTRLLEQAEPVYESLPGWRSDIGEARTFDDLPQAARTYIRRLRELCHNVPVLIVSVGPDRNQTIEVESLEP
jgi:adenylosuccinate synthase